MALYLLPTIAGTALFWAISRDHTKGLLVCYYIIGSFVGILVLALQMPAVNVAGYTKRVTATAFVFLGYCVGNIIDPHAFLESEAPIYETGCKVCMACACGQVGLALGLRALLIHRNRKKDQQQASMINIPLDETEMNVSDLTDFENPTFRYSY